MSLRVTVTDEQTGDNSTMRVAEGDYVLVCAEPCRLAGTQAYPMRGTHVLTVHGHGPRPLPDDAECAVHV